MRKITVFLLLLPLGACIPVEDLGEYWAKAGKDPGLAGSWRVLEGPPENIGLLRTFFETGESYDVSTRTAEGKPVNADVPPLALKTLPAGPYHFLICCSADKNPEGRHEGIIERYRIDGDSLQIYQSLGGSLLKFVRTRYANTLNIRRNRGEGEYVRIIRFNSDVVRILSEVPDTEEYWIPFEKLGRIR